VADRAVHVLVHGVAGGKHVAVHELHRLGALSAELARDDDLAALGPRLHDVPQHAVTRPPHGQAAQELVTQRLGLGDRAQAAGGHLLRVQLDRPVRELEPLLDGGRQLADAAPLLAQDVLGAGRPDDDLRAHGGDPDLHPGVALPEGSG